MKILRFIGVSIPLLFLLLVLVCSCYNPWFNFLDNSFSSLGSVSEHGATKPWIYNIGMVVLGAMACAYAVSFIHDSINKIETVAGVFLMSVGLFLALVGIHPMGTPHHGVMSTKYFYGAEITMLVCGTSLFLSEHWKTGLIIVGIELPAVLIALYVNWPSVAVEEAYAITVLEFRLVLLTRVQMLREVLKRKN